MYKSEDYTTKIYVNLKAGVYIFERQSASGKTHLCKCLRKLCSYGDPVNAYTYEDVLRGVSSKSVLVPNKYAVIMLDRFDLYKDAGTIELIKECAKTSVILIDCKQTSNLFEDNEMCCVQFEPGRIEVNIW